MTEPDAKPLSRPHGGRLLLCNIGRIGDTILFNAILDSAFRTYSRVDFLCGRHNEDLVRADSRLGQVTCIPNLIAGLPRLFRTLLRCRYDAYIDLKDHASTTSVIIARFVRSRVKTGFNHRCFRPFQRDTRPLSSAAAHKVEITRRIGALAGLAAGQYKPYLTVPKDSIEWFQRHHASDAPFVFINLSASNAKRVWPVANWARYVRGCGLSSEPILISGVPRDREMVQRLCAELPNAAPYPARHFLDVVAAVARAHLVLSVDTGVVHACSALDKPLVAFYRAHRTAATHAPLSTWRLIIQPPSGIVSDIDPEQAIAETRRRGLPPPFSLPKVDGLNAVVQSESR